MHIYISELNSLYFIIVVIIYLKKKYFGGISTIIIIISNNQIMKGTNSIEKKQENINFVIFARNIILNSFILI